MLNKRSTFTQNLNNRKGQVALFIALIFQILFLFFAMVINVGLLVHHKINLQNSVDLAAYYGAMKQAEGMNVVAHTNYQIRQSWKLLTWRYRMLGSAGDFEEHPFDKVTRGLKGSDEDGINMSAEDFYNAPAFCITYIPFKPMPPEENTCKSLKNLSGIKIFTPPPVFIDLPNVSRSVRTLSEQMRSKAFERCRDFGSFNYKILGSFVVGYNIDQASRMEFINYLARAMSPDDPKADFYDIDGQSVREGIKKTLFNNLTSANLDSMKKNETFEVYNSLGNPNCNKSGVQSGAPPKWLVPIKIAPGFVYVDTVCEGASNTIRPKKMMLQKDNKPTHYKNTIFASEIDEIAEFIRVAAPPLESPYNFSVGVEKNPYCMAYVGVSATTQPNIPFSPFGAVTLKARAFYKPFGGRIGPWVGRTWRSKQVPSKGSDQLARSSQLDPNIPPRVIDVGNIGDPADPSRAANYSRFIGDQWGLKSRRALFQYGQAVYKLDPLWQGSNNYNPPIPDPNGVYYGDSAPNFEHWRHLPFNFYRKDDTQDIMAWDSGKNTPSGMRDLEMSAVLPDAFDFAYYSIQPNFYQTYYKRIKDGFLKGPGAGYYTQGPPALGSREFLGDLGTHKGGGKVGGVNYDEFSVKDQYTVVKNSGHLRNFVDIESKLTYISKQWEHALTGWAPQSLMDYSLDTNKFGKCKTYPKGANSGNPNADVEVPTSGNCAMGGSVGYSVKLISSDYLRSEIRNIGGDGVNGTLLNPPPPDNEF
ncbi:Tad domain-containing protein [uncultured Bdellovibrio sp.]|uniref:Tad domain-containing protein n=1 Tax=Bdellovibrio sp. HCB-162 TaxID=3394234 RepID=UPI0025DC457E|nr:Tad domain-containing protein [uncultured Bdellovibrio sp.]